MCIRDRRNINNFLDSTEMELEVSCGSVLLARQLKRAGEVDKTLGRPSGLMVSGNKNDPTGLKLAKRKTKNLDASAKKEADEPSKDTSETGKQKEITETAIAEEVKSDEIVGPTNHLGFSSVIELMILSKKPLIGHNLILDLGFLYDHFVGELPDNFQTFAERVHVAFPIIYDTKILSNHIYDIMHINNDLAGLYRDCFVKDKTLKKYCNLYLSPIDGACKYTYGAEDGQFHEAGYDAFITGAAFLSMVNFLTVKSAKAPQSKKGGGNVDEKIKEAIGQPCDLKNSENLANIVYSAGIKHYTFDLAKLKEIEVHHQSTFIDNTVYFETADLLSIEELGKIFSEHGDLKLLLTTPTSGYAEYSQTSPIHQGKIDNVVLAVNEKNKMIKCTNYVNRRRFMARKLLIQCFDMNLKIQQKRFTFIHSSKTSLLCAPCTKKSRDIYEQLNRKTMEVKKLMNLLNSRCTIQYQISSYPEFCHRCTVFLLCPLQYRSCLLYTSPSPRDQA
eukprot:TRINITY_DN3393_c0_g1_i2.p1 TRINITY_DN3393_c0_g1~~TRINITY_DN3393_c0_g1_i2.p1  ORF type:complete len:503 (+),score=30.49 TRINITY_DN3393_c0_g1_i2:66-1574(+)